MRNIFRSAKPRNNMIFSVVRDAQARESLEVLEKILDCSQAQGEGHCVHPAHRFRYRGAPGSLIAQKAGAPPGIFSRLSPAN